MTTATAVEARFVTPAGGLTAAQVAARSEGTPVPRPSRSLADIARANIVTRFNALLAGLFAVILATGHWQNGLFVGVVITNSAIGIIQELRAKRTLDKLAVLTAPMARIRRDGVVAEHDAAAVVMDDLMEIQTGDQIVADGVVRDAVGLEVDESLLTGESEPVDKSAGDDVRSGSFVIAGRGEFQATAVGADSYAARLTAEARQFKLANSELVAGTNKLLRWISFGMLIVAPILLFSQLRSPDNPGWREALTGVVAALVGMVPDGLVLLTSLAFVVATLTLARRSTLVQELPAVEGLARVDVVCLDKTGTLTTGEVMLEGVKVLDMQGPYNGDVFDALSLLAKHSTNPTGAAVAAAFGHTSWVATGEIPFSSPRKWSAIAAGEHGSWVLGAPELVLASGLDAVNAATTAEPGLVTGPPAEAIDGLGAVMAPTLAPAAVPEPLASAIDGPGSALAPTLELSPSRSRPMPLRRAKVRFASRLRTAPEPISQWAYPEGPEAHESLIPAPSAPPDVASAVASAQQLAATGRRVMVLARSDAPLLGQSLPENLVPIALVVLTERVRPDASRTLRYFQQQGVALKVISGDSPQTVGAVAARLGVPGVASAADAFDARKLPSDPAQLDPLVQNTAAFGRVTPDQKRAIVGALQRDGHVVAMTGDGVNDALALKDADVGIAMGNGAAATKAVAQLVLLDGRFAHLPRVVAEGRRVIANIERAANLFLVKNVYSLVLALTTAVTGSTFPLLPIQLTLISVLTVGVPGFLLALAPNQRRYVPGFIGRVMWFAIPIGVLTAVAAYAGFSISRVLMPEPTPAESRTVAAIVVLITSLWTVGILSRPLSRLKIAMLVGLATVAAVAVIVPTFGERVFLMSLTPFTGVLAVWLGAAGCAMVELAYRLVRRRHPIGADPVRVAPGAAITAPPLG